MFEIKCDGCGRKAEVPFKPRAGKPVYCRTCFSERRSNRSRKAGLNFSFNEKNAWARRGKVSQAEGKGNQLAFFKDK